MKKLDKLDLVLSVLFLSGTAITMVLIYYYNQRHSYEEPDELDEFVVETKSDEKSIFQFI